MMRVSVVLATYNGSEYVEAQLDSVVRQSRPPDEIVVYDDGSSDDTVARCERLLGAAQITHTIVRGSSNVGVSRAFSEAVRTTAGDVVFL